MKVDAMNLGDGALHMLDQRLDIGRKRAPVIDDEIRVLQGYRGIADAKALEAGAFDQTRRMIARRIGEYRSATPLADGLRLLALVEQFANRVDVDAGCAVEFEPGADEPFIVRALHRAITDVVVGGLPRVPRAVTIEYIDFDDVIPSDFTPGARVHRERAAQGP